MTFDRKDIRTRRSSEDTGDDSSNFELLSDAPPTILRASSRYEILNELARGGEGIVYLARDSELRRNVAVKILRPDLSDRSSAIKRFQQEALVMCRLQHPGIPQIYDVGTCLDGRPYHAMKLVKGEDMFNMLDRLPNVPMQRSEALRAFAKVCDTMAYTHSKGIVHLDLKPLNYMIGCFGEVHVMDWGTARVLDSDGIYRSVSIPQSPDENNRTVGGTLQYMCPEQTRGEVLDRRADVFGLGGTLCHILTGEPTFVCEKRRDAMRMSSQGELGSTYDRLSRCGADPVLVRLAIRCLQADPANRPRDAGEVARELAAYEHAALRRFESDMSRFFELSHDLFCFAGMDGFFRRINDNFTKVLGYSEAELLSMPFMYFVHPEDQAPTMVAMQDLSEGKPVIRFRNRYRKKNGEYVVFEWTAKSIIEEDLIFAVARDVT
jgi:eukaryotic-like serine/threonine-protein kinase